MLVEMASRGAAMSTAPVAAAQTDPMLQAIQQLTASVNALRTEGREGHEDRYRPRQSEPSQPAPHQQKKYQKTKGQCRRCNHGEFHLLEQCGARGFVCFKCHKPNHFSDLCQANNTNSQKQGFAPACKCNFKGRQPVKNNSKTSATQNSKKVEGAPAEKCANICLTAPLFQNTVLVTVGDRRTQALVDTGAAISCTSRAFLGKTSLNHGQLKPSDISTIVGVGNTHHKVLGTLDIDVAIGGAKFSQIFYVIDQLYHPVILGQDFLSKHNAKIDFSKNLLSLQEGIVVANLQTPTDSVA